MDCFRGTTVVLLELAVVVAGVLAVVPGLLARAGNMVVVVVVVASGTAELVSKASLLSDMLINVRNCTLCLKRTIPLM